MRLRLPTVIASLPRRAARYRWRSGGRDLRRELNEQATEEYWRRRERSNSRRFKVVKLRYNLWSLAAGMRDSAGIIRSTVISLVRSAARGALLLGVVLVVEKILDHYAGLGLVPQGQAAPPLGAFPDLAVQVLAAFVGFYLATVGIVLGNAYDDVSAAVRSLVLENPRTRLYLASIGTAIGAGLFLVLLQSFGLVSFGYLTVGAYALLVCFGGWAFVQLALDAFNLMNPIALGGEPLQALYRAIDRLDSKGLAGDEAVLRSAARRSDQALRILAELIDLTGDRRSVDRDDLADLVELLLMQVRFYARRKHLLAPTSAWFIPEPVYPKWIETGHSQVSIALQTSTSLHPRMEPAVGWLERRSAELAASAIETCVAVDDRNAALRITRAAASTIQTLAECSHLEDAITFAEIVRDRCWAIQSDNAAANAVVSETPLLLTNFFLGWRDAIASWPEEIRTTVSATEWDRTDTAVVQIRGSARVWTAAQQLLREVRAEHAIEGRRVTPDWYLRYALAGACTLSLQEFAKQLPELLDDYFTGAAFAQSSPVVKAGTGAQALQALAKAELVVDTIPQVLKELEMLRLGHDPLPTSEIEGLADRVQASRSLVLGRIAEAVTKLQPERSEAAPDLFGESLFKLVHYTEQAIASGDVDLVRRVFPQVLLATMTLHEYVRSTYSPPTYEVNSALFDPIVDLLELSGLAMIYEVLRDDRSADPVRHAWRNWSQSKAQPESVAKVLLGMLDLVDGGFTFGISPRSIARTEWERRLSERIVEADYARPEASPLGDRPAWTAPPLIKILGVSKFMRSIALPPRTIFAAEVIAPLSGESEEMLRARRGLRHYYERRDRYGPSDVSDGVVGDEGEDGETISND